MMRLPQPLPGPSILLHHPAFQSLALPLLAAALAAGVLGRLAGPAGAALGPGLGWLLALAWWPGFGGPAGAAAQGLPWVALLAWLGSCAWLWRRQASVGQQPAPGARAALWLLVLACLALAAVVAMGGSLRLAQWAASAAASLLVLGAVQQLQPAALRHGLGVVLLPWRLTALCLVVLWGLGSAQGWLLSLPPMLLLALGLMGPWWGFRGPALPARTRAPWARPAWWLPLACLGLAVAWQAGVAPRLQALQAADADPYYSPGRP